MDQKCDRLYPSTPLDYINLGQRLERKFNDVSSFNNSIHHIKEMITYFTDKNNKSKKKYKKYKTVTTIITSFDTFVIIATTSSSITLSLTGIRLIAIPISSATASGLSIDNKVLYEIFINNEKKIQETI